MPPHRLVALLVVLLAGCGGDADIGAPREGAPPDGPAYVEGTVTSVSPVAQDPGCVPADGDVAPDAPVSSDDAPVCADEDAAFGTVLVEGEGDAVASVTVLPDTDVLRQLGGAYEPVAFADLAVGEVVSVWITGHVRESFPPQVDATAIVIVEDQPA